MKKKKIKTLTTDILKGVKPIIAEETTIPVANNKKTVTTIKKVNGGAYDKLKNVDLNKKPMEKTKKVKQKFIEIKL